MSAIEPDVKNFLAKVANSLSIGLLWLLINSTIGIGFNFAFFENKPSIGNYIFYAWFLISLIFLIIYFRRKWKL
ncbi:MAG: hypothetical protein M3004_07955 [Bacteroidota bacterium]|nr:hypothetical protein [Bacteroidota bacterium]